MVVRTLRRAAYHFGVASMKAYGWAAWDFRIFGAEPIPTGPKIYVCNHVTSLDPYWLMMACPDFLHFVVGPPYHIRGAGPILRAFEQINALPPHRKQAVAAACHYLAQGESVCICPEGDVHPPFELGHFYAGVAKMYCASRAPIVPIALAVDPTRIRRHPRWDIHVNGETFEARMYWHGRVRMRFGAAMTPEFSLPADEDTHRRITGLVRDQIARMLRELRSEF